MARVTATEASRGFSELLNRVARGEEIEIVRSGAVVAVVSPAHVHLVPGQQLIDLLAELPPLDDDFARDVAEARKEIGPPREIDWPD